MARTPCGWGYKGEAPPTATLRELISDSVLTSMLSHPMLASLLKRA